MARRLFFVDAVRRERAELRGEDAHHLTRVLRVALGQVYEISDNQRLYLAEVETARKDLVVFRVLEEQAPRAAPVRVTLLASLIKFDRFEWMVEKAAELGAETLVPVIAARCDKGLDRAAPKRLERWRRIALEASQQARRPRLPVLEEPQPLEGALRRAADLRFFLDEAAGAPALWFKEPPRNASVALLAGPEGGWIEEERSAALDAGWRPVSLGRHVLRAETAAAAALAIVNNAWQAAYDSIPI